MKEGEKRKASRKLKIHVKSLTRKNLELSENRKAASGAGV